VGRGRLNQEIANAVVRTHHDHLGRGPSKARAFYNHDMIVVVLRGIFSASERSLIAHGNQAAVQKLRQEARTAMRPDLVHAVEALTGLNVDAFMSATHINPDITVETFVLDHPLPSESPSVTEATSAAP